MEHYADVVRILPHLHSPLVVDIGGPSSVRLPHEQVMQPVLAACVG